MLPWNRNHGNALCFLQSNLIKNLKTGYILGSLIIVITIISVYFSTCLIVEIVKEMNVIDPNYQDII
jgi:hypothetical protein